jgi:hypothetical protein
VVATIVGGAALSAALVVRHRRRYRAAAAPPAQRKMRNAHFEFVAGSGAGGHDKKRKKKRTQAEANGGGMAGTLEEEAFLFASGAGAGAGAAPATRVVVVPTTTVYRRMASRLRGTVDLAVEIGSGYGNTTAALAKAVGDKGKCIGIDQSWKKAKGARENYPGIRFERLDILEDMAFVRRVCLEQTDAQSCSGRRKTIITFIDIGGVRELSALVRVIPWAVEELGSALVVIKSKRLAAVQSSSNCSAAPAPSLNAKKMPSFWASVVEAERREGMRGKTRRGVADRYPLKMPVRYAAGDGREICRFHNYSQAGCIRGQQGRCDLNHDTCHWCGERGHVAFHCTRVTASQPKSFGADARLCAPLKVPAPFLYVLGGRLRGKTLIGCERMRLGGVHYQPKRNINDSTRNQNNNNHGAAEAAVGWECAPALMDHRGSHGAAAVDGVNAIYVVGGGGLRANLSSGERLRTTSENRTWEYIPRLCDPRHAFVLVSSSAENALYAIGGWTHGNTPMSSVERFGLNEPDLGWTKCPSLNIARRLHGAAVHKGTIYVFGGSHGQGNVATKIRTASVESLICIAGAVARDTGGNNANDTNSSSPSWVRRRDLPKPMLAVAVTVKDSIWLLPNGDDELLCYSPDTDTYVKKGKLPLRDWHSFAVTHNALIDPDGFYVVGGKSEGAWQTKAYRYNVVSECWEALPSMKTARRRTACALVMGV